MANRSLTFQAILFLTLFLVSACSQSMQEVDSTTSDNSDTGNAEIPKAPYSSTQKRANILLIVADDLGYSDLGAFGGEIDTPNLDTLARNGVLLSNFHSTASCSPTRSMLLSGTDHHLAGLGNMLEHMAPNQSGNPGYEGYLNFRVATVAELLRDAGYDTYMTGKWHLGLSNDTSPKARGFEKSFAMLMGGGGHFDDMPLVGPGKVRYQENGKDINLPLDFYSSQTYADKLIEYIGQRQHDNPFFAYLAFSAPHWPLQAPAASISKYKGKYDEGYDVLSARRIQRMQELSLISAETKPFPRVEGEPAWSNLSSEDKKIEARKMEIYAAMVDDMDIYIGKVIDHLKKIGEYENTYIFFMSDNGAEGHHLDETIDILADWINKCCDNSYENMGSRDSYIWYGPNWARVSSTPFNMYKGFTTEGGVRVPAVISHHSLNHKGNNISSGFATVMDVMPTILDIAGVSHPGTKYHGKEILPMQGSSMLSMLKRETPSVHDENHVTGWALFARRALRQGDWKVVSGQPPYTQGEWQLYNLAKDPSELDDLSVTMPEKHQELIKLWHQYAADNNVILPDRFMNY